MRSTHEVCQAVVDHLETHVAQCASARPTCCTSSLSGVVTIGAPHVESGRLSAWIAQQRNLSQAQPSVMRWSMGVQWSSDGHPTIGDAAHPGTIPNERMRDVVPYFHSVHAAVLHGIATLQGPSFRSVVLDRAVPLSPDGNVAGWRYELSFIPRR